MLLRALTSGVKHLYPTRTANKRVVAEASLAVANTSFRCRASTQFAALPEEIKEEQNTQLFLNKLKRFTLAISSLEETLHYHRIAFILSLKVVIKAMLF